MYDKNYIIEKLKERISEKLTELMDDYAVTCQELGDRIGKTNQIISMYNRKKSLPSIETIYMIAAEFNLPITEFLPLTINDLNKDEDINITHSNMIKEFKNLYFENDEPLYIQKLFLDNEDN